MAKYIITGGAGFIGSHVVEELVRRKEQVVVIDNLLTGKRSNIEPFLDNINFIHGSIENRDMLETEFKDADYVIHLAALPSVPRSIREPVLSDKINVNGTLCVFETARKTGKKVVYASSSSVYGDSKDLPKREANTGFPLSPYALQKLTNEKYAAIYNSTFGCNFVGLRLFNVFGPRQDPDSEYSAVIPKFIKTISKDKVPIIYGDGKTSRDFTYVKNVVSAILLACEHDTEQKIFNVATGSSVSLNDLVEKIGRVCDKKVSTVYAKERQGDIKHSLADISLAKAYLEYYPKYTFDEGLAETVQSILQNTKYESKEKQTAKISEQDV